MPRDAGGERMSYRHMVMVVAVETITAERLEKRCKISATTYTAHLKSTIFLMRPQGCPTCAVETWTVVSFWPFVFRPITRWENKSQFLLCPIVLPAIYDNRK